MGARDIALFANNANTTLASPITNVALSLTVIPGAGSQFPSLGSEQFFIATLVDQATRLIKEIVHVTARVGDVMTIVRGQEGTTPLAWNAGDIFCMLPTAGTLALFSQLPQSQAGLQNYSVDTGTANNYVATLSPAVSGRVVGLRANIKAANANSGPSTLDLGAGPISLTNPDGSSLGTGAIVANGVFTIIDTGSGPYQLISASQQAQTLAGAATTGDFSMRPTNETKSGWVIANAQTIGNASSNATQRANADTANLFAWHWNNFSNTRCPVFTSAGVPTTRGANAAADFAANKQIATYDKRGKTDIGVEAMGGASNSGTLAGVPVQSGALTTPGSIIGENLHALISAENGTHTHVNTLTDNGHFHNITSNLTGTTFSKNVVEGTGGGSVGGGGVFGPAAVWNIAVANTGILIGNASSGSGTAHNTVSLADAMTYYIKL